MSAATIEKSGILTGRQMVMVAVVGLHGLVIGALMTARIVIEKSPPAAFKAITVQPPELPPPPPPVKLQPEHVAAPDWVPPALPPPQIVREELMRPSPETGITLRVPESPMGPLFDAPPVDIPATPLQHRTTRSPDDYYPAVSLRMQEQGDAVVRVCVGPTGRPEGAPQVERSSGSRRLDEAAVRWASEALEFTPATRNGAAVSACKGFRVNFTLR